MKTTTTKPGTIHIECALHPVSVKFVTGAYVSKIAQCSAAGVYDPAKNTIYIDKKLPDFERLHVLMHELKHAYDYQTRELNEEDNCDAFGALLIRLFNLKHVSDVCR